MKYKDGLPRGFSSIHLVSMALFIVICLPVGLAAQDREIPQAVTPAHVAAENFAGLSQPSPSPPPVSGSGTANYVPLWTSSTVLGNSKL